MSWTKEMITDYQKQNKLGLEEINESLRPDNKPTNGKIGIFIPGQNGDLMTAMSVLKYRNVLWSDKEIIWFCNMPNADALKYSPVNEVRPWPWAGNGLPIGTPDFYPLLCLNNNRLNKDFAKQYELTSDLDDGYFPAPHQLTVDQRHGIDYPNCSRRVFGIDPAWEWHPYLTYSEEEKERLENWANHGQYHFPTIMIENTCGSGQSIWNDEMTIEAMKLCQEAFGGNCRFIFASGGDHSRFYDGIKVKDASQFTVRQAGYLINFCHLFIGISSGISVSTSAWGLKPVPKIQFCGSFTCSTVTLANGTIDLITHDDKHPESAKNEFYNKLKEILKTI